MAGEQDDLQEHLSALLQWMISTNRVTVPPITAPSPDAEAAAPRALPAATAKKAAKTFRPMPATPEEAIAAGTSAMSARFLKEWKEEGYPGLPLRNPSPERQVAAAAAATATAAATAAPAAGALKRTLDGAYSHSLYNKDMEGGGAAAAPPVPAAAAAASSSGSDGSKAAGRDDLVMGEAKEEAVAKKPRNSPVAEREPEVDTDLCEEPGCRSSVRYGPADPASSGTRCARHKTKGMVEKARRRKACDTCTSRKVKCDGGQPSCGPCTARHDECRYSTRLKSGPKPGFNSDASAARPAHPKEIAPAPPAVFGGPRSAAAVAAAAAAVAALTSAPLSMSRPSPATATSRASKLPASSSAGGASGSKGRELESPRALAAHALTGFRATGGSASAGGIWPVLGSSSLAARAAAGGPDGSKGAAAAAAAGDLGGLAPLALAQLAAASPRLPLAMLGMLPAYGSLVGGLAGGSDGKTQQPPPPPAAAAAGAQGSPQTQQPQQQQRRKQKQNLAFLQPSPTPAGASRSPSEGAVHHESRPAVAVAKSEAAGDGADEQQLPDVVGGGSGLGAAAAATAAPTEDAEREIVASSSSSSMLLAAIAQDPALSAASAAQSDEAAAAAVEGVGAAAEGAVPAQELPLKSPSQGLNLLLFSQGLLQDAEGAARPASEIGEPMSPGGPAEREGVSDDGGEEGDEEGGAGMEVDDDPDPDPFPFFRKGPMRHPLRLRKSCDRCTMRKIKCDGTAVRCKRCEADGQYCHYSFKAKSGPKPNSPRKKMPTSPQKAAGAAADTEVPRFGQGSFAPLVPANRIHDTEAAAPTGSLTSIPAAAATAATVAVKKPPGCGHAEGVTQDMAGMTFQDLDQQRIVTPTAATPKAAAATAAAAAAAAAAMPSAIPTTTVQRTRTGRVAGKSPMPGGQPLGAVERSGGAAAAAAARIGADSAGGTGGVAQGVFSSVAAAAATAAGGGAGDGPGGGPLDGTGAQNEGRQLSRGTGMVF